MKEYTFQTAGPDIIARVYPTLEALGDQPWRVQLIGPSDRVELTDGSAFYEAPCGLQAATEAVEDWLASQGYENTSISVSL